MADDAPYTREDYLRIFQEQGGHQYSDREGFFQAAMHPDLLSDEMNFHITAPNSDGQRGFSQEGYEAIGYQFHDWVMARTLSHFRREGRFPTGLRAEVKLVWDDDREPDALAVESDEPWFHIPNKDGKPIPLDGQHRLSTFLKDRREG